MLYDVRFLTPNWALVSQMICPERLIARVEKIIDADCIITRIMTVGKKPIEHCWTETMSGLTVDNIYFFKQSVESHPL